jgi:hypothetical protein
MRSSVVLVSVLLLLAACGGPTPAAPTVGPPAEPTSPPQPTPVAVEGSPPAGTSAPIAGEPAPGPSGTLCHLVTLAEVEAATVAAMRRL